jgi:hypothetical protein
VNRGGWVTKFDLKYSQHELRPRWGTISGLSGPAPDGTAADHVNNYLYGEYGVDAATGGIYARRLQFHVRNFMAFPGFRFEVYGCDDEELFVGGNDFTLLSAPHNLIPNQIETVGVLCETNLTEQATEHFLTDR